MKPTKKFVLLIEKFFPYRFKLAKFTHLPIFRNIIKKMLFDKNNLTVITKDKVVEIPLNKKIKPPDTIVVPSKVVEYFIENASYHFIMDFCLCREAMQCKNHPIEFGCLFLGDAARNIPFELGKKVSKEEALEHAKKCRENGLVHVVGRDKLDEQWLGVGSKIPLLTICNCCSCCCLWRMLPNLNSELSSTVKKMPGLKTIVNDNCTGCGTCASNICFVKCIQIKDDVAVISDECRGCGRFAEVCPNNAIDVLIEDENFIKKTIERVKSSQNV
jgi:Pyruvate/2-oxoacid:ferredoxin oxidoreductase delta subunit